MRARRSTCAWVVAGLLVPGVVSAQGIADVAKREKGRLDQAKQQPGTTYTNDSFGGSAPAQKNAKPGSDAAKTPADGTKPTTDVAEPAADGAKVAGAGVTEASNPSADASSPGADAGRIAPRIGPGAHLLVTGGAGFIGSELVRQVLARRDGTRVTVLD